MVFRNSNEIRHPNVSSSVLGDFIASGARGHQKIDLVGRCKSTVHRTSSDKLVVTRE